MYLNSHTNVSSNYFLYVKILLLYIQSVYFPFLCTGLTCYRDASIPTNNQLICFLGILYKGSGENQFISLQPPVISTVMGNGRRRSISCPSCNGQAQGNKLLAPVALAWGIDGSLYVGDFNYIRRIYPSGNVTSIMELR